MRALPRFVKSLDELEAEQGAYYVSAEGGFALSPDLQELADQHNDLVRQIEEHDQNVESAVADAKKELSDLRRNVELDEAITSANVPPQFHAAVRALLRGSVTEDQTAESLVREFLDSNEGAAYRGPQAPMPHFSRRLRLVQ